ncbi:hypothetical protein WN943_008759 [Citrus x changshan-huyou]
MGNSASHCMRTLMLARLTGLDQGWRLPMNYEPPPGSGSRFGVVGLVPCMGESDTIEKEDADGYKGSLERLILYLRSDLNTPSLPFIQVAQALEKGNQLTECKMCSRGGIAA